MSAVSFIQQKVFPTVNAFCLLHRHLQQVRWQWLTDVWGGFSFLFTCRLWKEILVSGKWSMRYMGHQPSALSVSRGQWSWEYWVTEVFLIDTAVRLFSVSLSQCRSSWSNTSKGGTTQRHSGDLKASVQADGSGFLCWYVPLAPLSVTARV